ncbi:MAG: YdeI/OmpD-associated family protein [Gemmatimonadota bacterium]|nr:YdeI/OmpD-associated family protein [Gemmatimonadota bacterium]
MAGDTEIRFFRDLDAWRNWLEKNHAEKTEQWVGFYKKSSGKPSITWPESVDGALCYGWIDGIRKSIDDVSYKIRFTPRKRGSTWSSVNVRRVSALTEEGSMRPAGLAAFEALKPEKSGTYAYEQRAAAALSPEHETQFKANPKAWAFWQAKSPGFRKTASWWVVSAKQEATRAKRLALLIDDCAHGRTRW